MSAVQNLRLKIARLSWPVWLLIVTTLWLVAAGVLWWRIVYSDPRHVFEGMLRQNFSTVGYVRETDTTQQGVRSAEYAQLQTGAQTLVRTLTALTQGQDEVITDAISTRENEFVRYKKIDTSRKNEAGKEFDFSSAVNVWAKQASDGSNQAAAQMLLGLFPMGNVPAEDRREILEFMDKNVVFSVKYNTVKKERKNGRPVYTYEVQLMPQPYVDMLKRYGTAVGLSNHVKNLNPADYANTAPTNLTVTVDVISRQLKSVTFTESQGRKEVYSGHGILQDVQLPTKTISASELQQRLSAE